MSTTAFDEHSSASMAAVPSVATRRPRRLSWGQLVLHLILIIVALTAVMPMVWCFFASFKHFKELVSSTSLLPQVWTLDSYKAVFGLTGLWSGFRNTIIVTISVTAATVFTSALEGYVFAKFVFPGKNLLFMGLLATMMVPFFVVLLPLYLIVSGFGWVNHLTALIVPGLFSAFGIFLIRQFMFNVPDELIDSGRIDGASEWRIFMQIIIPLARSPMAALGILTFLGVWNDFVWPSTVLTSQNEQTLPVIITGLQGLYWQNYDYLITAAVVSVIPLMLAYIFGSRYMIQGIAMTGLKM